MSIQVDLCVKGVHVSMEARAVRDKGVFKLEGNLVEGVRFQVVPREMYFMLCKLYDAIWDYSPVDSELLYRLALEVQVQVSELLAV